MNYRLEAVTCAIDPYDFDVVKYIKSDRNYGDIFIYDDEEEDFLFEIEMKKYKSNNNLSGIIYKNIFFEEKLNHSYE